MTSEETPTDASKIPANENEPAIEHEIKAEQPNTGALENGPASTADMTPNMATKDTPSLNHRLSIPDSTDEPDEVDDPAPSPKMAPNKLEAVATDKPKDEQGGAGLQVIIVNKTSSPKIANENHKRPTPPSENEPPAKRPRGRPRKVQNCPQPQEDTSSNEDGATSPKTPGISIEIVNSPFSSIINERKIPEQSPEHIPSDIEATTSAKEAVMTLPTQHQQLDQHQLQDSTTPTIIRVASGEPTQNNPEIELIDDSIERNELNSSPLSSARSFEEEDSNEETSKEQSKLETEQDLKPELKPENLEITIRDIQSPLAFARNILKIDGRKPDGRTANAWKEIRCYRNNQDMGTLWEVRQAWYLKQK